ncbi:hypothetical protein BDZ90DRAFT_233698 [Jaminaea rosea]|uniref:Uncharacterized protein n=1 Tax=Jaminaea rosea TaxID=1569628 RepID=A0A316ULI9_9BASI|nr:hypothetical protein BDZ90DRAFT_233698 [Jaminaea rosea]PWN26127.1 hypothetical protein BDZ90DRAFT_233698 [Jaminaea rosea]
MPEQSGARIRDDISERTALLAAQQEERRGARRTGRARHSTNPDPDSGERLSKRSKAGFTLGILLLFVNLFTTLYLFLSLLLQPIAPLHLPLPIKANSPALLLCFNLHLIALLCVLPSLFSQETTKRSGLASLLHQASLALVVALGVAGVAAAEHRASGLASTFLPSLGVLLLSLPWSRAGKSAPVEDASVETVIASTHRPRSRARSWLHTSLSTLLCIGLALLLGNLVLDGLAQRAPEGPIDLSVLDEQERRVWVDLSQSRYLESLRGDTVSSLRSIPPFRLHLGVENAPKRRNSSDLTPLDFDSDSDSNSTEPLTALFFPPLHTATPGRAASRWLRHMVRRTAHLPAHNPNGTGDGHLALRRAVWFDPPGVGSSDLPSSNVGAAQPRLDLAALALLHALDTLDLKGNLSLICLGSGALFCDMFRSHLPAERLHSQILIDAQTAHSFYGNDVAPSLRVGHNAPGHSTLFGLARRDVLPALLGPLFPWSLTGAKSPAERLTSLAWRQDASSGLSSPIYEALQRIEESRRSALSSRPTAVLSSFWALPRRDCAMGEGGGILGRMVEAAWSRRGGGEVGRGWRRRNLWSQRGWREDLVRGGGKEGVGVGDGETEARNGGSVIDSREFRLALRADMRSANTIPSPPL